MSQQRPLAVQDAGQQQQQPPQHTSLLLPLRCSCPSSLTNTMHSSNQNQQRAPSTGQEQDNSGQHQHSAQYQRLPSCLTTGPPSAFRPAHQHLTHSSQSSTALISLPVIQMRMPQADVALLQQLHNSSCSPQLCCSRPNARHLHPPTDAAEADQSRGQA